MPIVIRAPQTFRRGMSAHEPALQQSPVFSKPLSSSTPNRDSDPSLSSYGRASPPNNLSYVVSPGPDPDTSPPSLPKSRPPTNFRLSSQADVPGLSFSSSEDPQTTGPVFFIGDPLLDNSRTGGGGGTMTNGHEAPEVNHNYSPQPGQATTAAGLGRRQQEEKYECLADGSESFFDSTPSDNTSLPFPRDPNDVSAGGSNVWEGSSSSGVSSLPFRRNSLLRSSLRKSPQQQANGETMGHRRWGSFRNTTGTKRPIAPVTSSSALASSLYRSSSFHSSGRSSAGDGEEMYSDGSLEDEVIDLTQKVHHLEEKFTVLAENQTDVDDRYTRAKTENAELSTKLFMAEEQVRDTESRAQERLREEQRRFKESLSRLERESQLTVENFEIRLGSQEKDLESHKAEAGRYKRLLDRERAERIQLSDKLLEADRELGTLREDNRRLMDEARTDRESLTLESIGSQQALLDLKREFESLRKYQIVKSTAPNIPHRESLDGDLNEYHSRLIELESENRRLKNENKQLRESNDELTAQVLNHGLEEGRHLLTMNPISGMENSLAAEFEAMSQDQMKTALKEQKEVNDQLKAYIDGILLNIVENYPQLLEVKNKCHPGDC